MNKKYLAGDYFAFRGGRKQGLIAARREDADYFFCNNVVSKK